MKVVFERAVGQMFEGLGQPARYCPQGTAEMEIVVIPKMPDALLDYRDTRIHSETLTLQVQKCEVPNPASGDQVIFNGHCYRIQGEPRLDLHGLVYALEAVSCD